MVISKKQKKIISVLILILMLLVVALSISFVSDDFFNMSKIEFFKAYWKEGLIFFGIYGLLSIALDMLDI